MKKKTQAPEHADGFVFTVNTDQLVFKYETRESNPNKMPPELYDILKASIASEGFLQPVLVQPIDRKTDDGRPMYEVLDGHHRGWAAIEEKKAQITAVLKNASAPKALALSIGMNKIRGELDYSMAAETLRQLADATDWDASQISLLTGFSVEEIEALTNDFQADADELLEDVASAPSEDESPDKAPKPFVLEIRFESRESYKLARRKLKKAAGKGGDLSVGLLNALGELDALQER